MTMPEGPEIRRAADRIARAIEQREALDVVFTLPELRHQGSAFRGRTVRAVETRGKALLIRFTGGLSIYSHNQLYGRWYVCAPGTTPDTGRQLRLAIHTREASALLYSASDIAVLDAASEAAHPFLARLGPDILDPRLRPARIRARLGQVRFRGRQLGSLLLDQGFLAGNGNYLRSEILFVAGLKPDTRPRDLDREALTRLARSVREISRRAYRTGGLTNDPASVKALKAAGVPRSDHRFFVFGREGKPCRVCGEIIVREAVAGRRLYRCPACQV
jgi:endonuclease-8